MSRETDMPAWTSATFRFGALAAFYNLGSYRIATDPEPNSSRLTSFKSMRFVSPNNVGP
jgi:hypothetical protein